MMILLLSGRLIRFLCIKDQHELSSGEYTVIPWVISTASGFSADAITMAQENNVRLITGTEFARLLIDAGITDINKAFE